jgi:DNA-binding CsgD family transcriptional regulator
MPAITSRQLAVEPRGRARASAPHRCEGGQPFQAATLYRRADRAWEVDAARRACLERFGVAAPENDEQREQIVIGLREEGHSPRAIAGALGLSAAQVRRDLAKLPKRAADEDSRRLERLRLHQARKIPMPRS